MSGANRQSQKRRGWNRQTTRVLIFEKPRFLRRANRQSQKRGGWNRQTSISFLKNPDFYERGLIFEKPRFLRRANRQSQKRGGWNRQTTSTHFRKAQIFKDSARKGNHLQHIGATSTHVCRRVYIYIRVCHPTTH